MRTSSFVSFVFLTLVVGCAAPPSSPPEDGQSDSEVKAASADGDSKSADAPSKTTAPAASSSAAAASPSNATVPPLPGSSGGPAPDQSRPPPPAPVNPPPVDPPVVANTCYAQCLAPKGASINAFDACSQNCGETETACFDNCWTVSGCEANEAQCQEAYATCDVECPEP